MATEIIHGPPGAFKSSSLLSLYLFDALKSNRTIITNIRGFLDIDGLNDHYMSGGFFSKKLKKPSTSKIIFIEHDRDGFYKMARFFHWAPKNAIFLMDEGQQVYPSRNTKLNEYDLDNNDDPEWPLTVENAFDKHRHMGWDIYISTTNIAKIHKEVRQVAEFAYRHKNMAGVFKVPFLSGLFKRVQHDPENSGKSLNHVLSSSLKTIDSRVFNLYQSTTTGNAKDVESNNTLFTNPKFLIMLCFIFYFVYSFGAYYVSSGSFNPMASASSSLDKEEGVLSPPKPGNSLRTQTNSGVSSSYVRHRFGTQDNVIALLDSINYEAMTVNYSSGRSIRFHTDMGYILGTELASMGVFIRSLRNIHILSYRDYQRFVPVGNPNPDYYHPDNDQPSPETIQVVESVGVVTQ